jgi:hypothetical protein
LLRPSLSFITRLPGATHGSSAPTIPENFEKDKHLDIYGAIHPIYSMLATQQCDTGRHIWSSSKLGAFHKDPASPRMSSREQVKTQQDWREQYSQFLPSNESSLLPTHFDQVVGFDSNDNSSTQRQFVARPQLEHRHSVAQLDNRQDVTQTVTINRPGSAPGNFEQQASSNGLGQDSVDPAESTAQLLTSAPLGSMSPSMKSKTDISSGLREDLNPTDAKDGEEEDEDEDDDMLDAEEGGGLPQTEAERRAERRKMKRFR